MKIGIDSANGGLRSELEFIKAAVHTTQVTIAALTGPLDAMETGNRGVKRRLFDPEVSHCEQQYASPPPQAVKKVLPGHLGVKIDVTVAVRSEEEVESLEGKKAAADFDKRRVGMKAIPILTKKGSLMKMKNIFYLRKTVEDGCVTVETDVYYESD